jgi:hypothetical protein
MIRAFALLGLVVALGCGSSGVGKSAAESQSDCTVFVSAVYCPKLTGCEAISQADCVSTAETQLGCAKPVGEDGELATCETDLGGETCAALVDGSGNVTLPLSCKGVFIQPH